IALLRVVPEGTFKRLLTGVKWITLVLLLLCFVPFAVMQVQSALYPQLELANSFYGQRGLIWDPLANMVSVRARARNADREPYYQTDDVQCGYVKGLSGSLADLPTEAASKASTASRPRNKMAGESYAEQQEMSQFLNMAQSSDAQVQTGCAVPEWEGNQISCY